MKDKGQPTAWVRTTLDSVSTIILGQSPDSAFYNESGEGLPFFQGKTEFGDIYPEVRKWCIQPKKVAQHNDILISVRAPVGPTNLAPCECCIGRGLAAIRPLCNIPYLWMLYLLRSKAQHLADQGTGSTFEAINGNVLRNLGVDLPPVAEQHRIVAKLEELFSKLDAGVASLRRAQRRLIRYRQALLQAAVTGELSRELREGQTHDVQIGKLDAESPAWLPANWNWTTLGDASQVTGGLTKNASRPAMPMKVPYLRVANVYADELRLRDVEEIGIQESELRRALLQANDLLVVEGNGSVDQIGRAAIWDGSINPCVHQNHIIKVRLAERVLPRFAMLWLLSPLGRDAIVDQASSTSGLYTLSISKVSGLPLPIPPMHEQEAVIAEYDRRNSLADALGAAIQTSLLRAERLRQSILERAFRGELVPQDPNDEPAEALLAHLKAVTAEAPASRRRGRPPKAESATPQPPRRRGRPEKAAALTAGGSA